MSKETLGYLSIVLTIMSIAPYYYSIAKGRTKPHAFSWLIWGMLGAIAFAAQYIEGAGPGAWGTGLGTFNCLSIAAIALLQGEHKITRGDWITFVSALSALPCWYIMHDPLYAVILITVVDMLAYYPTFRKSYWRPHQEAILIHMIGALKWAVSLLAIEHWSLTTWLYPAMVSLASFVLTVLLIVRRKMV